jgi:hypothetical protein
VAEHLCPTLRQPHFIDSGRFSGERSDIIACSTGHPTFGVHSMCARNTHSNFASYALENFKFDSYN